MFAANTYVIRLAGDADESALERLAQLDSAAPLEHPILVGEIARAAGLEASARTPHVAERIRAAMARNRLGYG
jgi:hypothetical protein